MAESLILRQAQYKTVELLTGLYGGDDVLGRMRAGVADGAVEERSFDSCTAAGCHGTEDAARSAFLVAKDRLARLVEELDSLLEQVPDSEFDSDDNIFTTAEGANFNAGLGSIRSSAIHNPFLTEALLVASIDIVEEEYGVMNSMGVVDWDAELQAIKAKVGR